RRDARPLDEFVRRDEEVAVERLERGHPVARRDHPAEPVTGHRIRLGEAVQDERAVRELEDRPVPPLVARAVIDRVGPGSRATAGEVPAVTWTWSGDTLTPYVAA